MNKTSKKRRNRYLKYEICWAYGAQRLDTIWIQKYQILSNDNKEKGARVRMENHFFRMQSFYPERSPRKTMSY